MFKKSTVLLIVGLLLSSGAHAKDEETQLDRMMGLQTQIDMLRKQNEFDQLSKMNNTSVQLPAIESVSCFNGKCTARIIDGDGITRTVEKGGVIDGVGTVSGISDRGVLVSTGGKRLALQLPYQPNKNAVAGTQPQYQGGMRALNLPPVPTR